MSLIVHISDLHFSKSDFNKDKFQEAVNEINALNPDFIILTGDLTDNGYYREFEKVTNYIAMFQPPLFIIPGNHDSRNLGYESFEELIGERSWKITVGDDLVVIGLDSSAPDLNSGNIGRPQQAWLDHELDQCVMESKFIIVALHHHIIPVPRTGRERNILYDAGEILQTLTMHEVDLVISGHKHVPNVWKINNTIFANAGSVSSYKLRGDDVNSYNIYNITEDFIEVFLQKVGGERFLIDKFERNKV